MISKATPPRQRSMKIHGGNQHCGQLYTSTPMSVFRAVTEFWSSAKQYTPKHVYFKVIVQEGKLWDTFGANLAVGHDACG